MEIPVTVYTLTHNGKLIHVSGRRSEVERAGVDAANTELSRSETPASYKLGSLLGLNWNGSDLEVFNNDRQRWEPTGFLITMWEL